MSKRVTVIVEGREYIVEVGDLSESPIKATVNQRTYRVEVPERTPHEVPEQSSPAPGRDVPPAVPAPAARREPPRTPGASNSAVIAPMPGNIIEIMVKAGDAVNPGDVICVLEAMKMNNLIRTNHAGVIASVDVVAGQAVDYGAVLATFE